MLHLKYRPQTFDEVIGRDSVVTSLKNLLSSDSPPQTILFSGPTGCGKTTLARICAKYINCHDDEIREINSADFRGIDTVREIIEVSHYLPLRGDKKVWIIDECHKLTPDAQNAFLKILEEPPRNVFFFLCTTDPEKLIPTIRSRCLQFKLSEMDDENMLKILRRICRSEGVSLSRNAYEIIIQKSRGLPRTAIQILSQVLSLPDSAQSEWIDQVSFEETKSIELCRALLKRQGWGVLSQILKELNGKDPEAIRKHVLNYCAQVLLSQDNPAVAAIMEAFSETFYYDGKAKLIYACYRCAKEIG